MSKWRDGEKTSHMDRKTHIMPLPASPSCNARRADGPEALLISRGERGQWGRAIRRCRCALDNTRTLQEMLTRNLRFSELHSGPICARAYSYVMVGARAAVKHWAETVKSTLTSPVSHRNRRHNGNLCTRNDHC